MIDGGDSAEGKMEHFVVVVPITRPHLNILWQPSFFLDQARPELQKNIKNITSVVFTSLWFRSCKVRFIRVFTLSFSLSQTINLVIATYFVFNLRANYMMLFYL